MVDRPIIFSAPMVLACLREIEQPGSGKTMTRWLDTSPLRNCQPGDRLWVQETAYVWSAGYRDGSGRRISYRATEPDAPCTWTPAIHMFRFASRLTLTVMAVKLEPLLDISEEDARAEGFAEGTLGDATPPIDIGGGYTMQAYPTLCSAAGMFQIAWAESYPDWDGYSSPEVVAVTFRPELRNIDDVKEGR